MLTRILIITSIIFSIYITDLHGKTISMNGQLSGWLIYTENISDKLGFGTRYTPEFEIKKTLTEEGILDSEISFNIYGSTYIPCGSLDAFSDNADLKLYRAWARYSTSQFEARLGLQKINFGPAKILRSLMWFDRMDFRDPLELTEGVYALLTRYYFFNNSNIWLWGLYGNENPKGWEMIETDKTKFEAGGRCQFPIQKGELAVSLNSRYLDKDKWAVSVTSQIAPTLSDGLENRLAIDGNFDIGVGLWFETSISELKIDEGQLYYQNFATIGVDYTFNPGINVIFETFFQSAGLKIDRMQEAGKYSALSASYTFGLLDSFNLIGYYDWSQEDIYSFLRWQRTYDNWMFNLMFFASPDVGTGSFSGKGLQFLVTYNH